MYSLFLWNRWKSLGYLRWRNQHRNLKTLFWIKKKKAFFLRTVDHMEFISTRFVFLPLMSINVHLISRKVIYMMEELEAMLHKYRCSRNACSGTCFPGIAVSNQSYQRLYQIKFITESRKIKHCDVRWNSTQSSMVFNSYTVEWQL